MKYRWLTWGDLNGFLGLMVDNITNLVFLTAILTGVFHFPKEFIFTRMIPGTALGVLVGDLLYTWMAFRLAKKTGNPQVTAMPLGLDTPSTLGIAFAVLGPTYLASNDPYLTWYVGMATLFFIGLLKILITPFADWIREKVPQAGLLGSLAGIGLCLLAFMPLLEVFQLPLVGIVALGVLLYGLVARLRLPRGIPAVLTAVVLGTVLYYFLGSRGLLGSDFAVAAYQPALAFPLPTLAWLKGLGPALKYLPIAIPFGILTVVGGINVTESARAAGDAYKTGSVILVEAFSSLIAALCGGVAQTTPYIGHPAYKEMGARAGYTLITALFIGLGGILGYLSAIITWIPQAALAPIFVFIGLEIVAQAYKVCPSRHYPAVAFAILPIMAEFFRIKWVSILSDLNIDPLQMSPGMYRQFLTVNALGHGFILTGMLWGAFLALMIDRKLLASAGFLLITAFFTLFGVIHSAKLSGDIYLPWQAGSAIPYHYAAGYLLLALLLVLGFGFKAPAKSPIMEE